MPKSLKRSPKGRLTKLTGETIKYAHRDALLIKDHIIFPRSMSLVKRYLNRARAAGLIHSPRKFTVGVTALVAAGIAQADKHNDKYVRPRHIAAGWKNMLSLGGGNCLPWECFETSVIKRLEPLKESVPHLSELLGVMEESE